MHRIRSDLKYTTAARPGVDKAVEIIGFKGLDKWVNTMSKFSRFLEKKISLADLDIALRKNFSQMKTCSFESRTRDFVRWQRVW